MLNSSVLRWLVAALVLLGASCDQPKLPYRYTQIDSPACAGEHLLAASNFEMSRRKTAPPLTPDQIEELRRCPHQKHRLPAAVMKMGMDPDSIAPPDPETGAPVNEWVRMAAKRHPDTPLTQPDSYYLSFVEMEERDKNLEKIQRDTLIKHLKDQDRQGRQNVVVFYVHGWRHDAALRDGDVRKFRRLLGYSRAALNTRCIQNGTYCNAALTGVFAGWRGRLFDEGETETTANIGAGKGADSLFPILSFWDRYNRSVCLALGSKGCKLDVRTEFESPLKILLEAVQDSLSLAPGRPKADKLMIVGHSMGGNMLATMLLSDALKKIDSHTIGQEMQPIAGDLVVLLNPASPAANWTAIQLAERDKAGFARDDTRLSCLLGADPKVTECSQEDRNRWERWQGLYPATQRPIYVSLTATNQWGTLKDAGRDVEYDGATGRTFPLSQHVIGVSDEDRRVTIGHRLPDYTGSRSVKGQAVGTSHEMVVLRGAHTDDGKSYASTYLNSVSPKSAWCAPADGWLLHTRRPGDGKTVRSWDYGLGPKDSENNYVSSRNIGGPYNKAAVQWRQVLYPKSGAHLSVSSWTTPFWNTRALDTAIRGHAGWANYATWCALNQLVLDDVTARISAEPARTTTVGQRLLEPAAEDGPAR